MSNYRFCDNVYLVRGYKKACIYDLKHKKLYHISKEMADFIEACICDKKEIFTEQENVALKSLEENQILCDGRYTSSVMPDIMELKESIKIQFAWIEVCTSCNLRCIHCYNESSSECHIFMSLEKFKKVCDKLTTYGVESIQFIGGEPLCNKELRQMMEYASRKFKMIEVFTNGTMIDETWCKFFKEHHIRTALSVYSYIPEEHDKVTTLKGSYEKTLQAIELLKKYEIPYRVATTHMKGIEIGKENTKLFHITPNKDVIRMAGRGNIGLLSPELLKKKLITKNTFSRPLNPNDVKKAVGGHQCFASKIYISANLEVYPCVMERRISHGNLENTSLENVLNSEILSFNKDKIKECSECEFRYACYDCRPDSLTEDIQEKPYYCTYNVWNGFWKNEDDVVQTILNSK